MNWKLDRRGFLGGLFGAAVVPKVAQVVPNDVPEVAPEVPEAVEASGSVTFSPTVSYSFSTSASYAGGFCEECGTYIEDNPWDLCDRCRHVLEDRAKR